MKDLNIFELTTGLLGLDPTIKAIGWEVDIENEINEPVPETDAIKEYINDSFLIMDIREKGGWFKLIFIPHPTENTIYAFNDGISNLLDVGYKPPEEFLECFRDDDYYGEGYGPKLWGKIETLSPRLYEYYKYAVYEKAKTVISDYLGDHLMHEFMTNYVSPQINVGDEVVSKLYFTTNNEPKVGTIIAFDKDEDIYMIDFGDGNLLSHRGTEFNFKD